MNHGCKVGRVLRKLEVGEEMKRGDIYRHDLGGYQTVDAPWWGAKFDSDVYKPIYRPLTPEEVEEYKEKYRKTKGD